METRNPENLIAKTYAAIAAVLVMGLFVAAQHVAPADAATGNAQLRADRPETPAAGYAAARFGIKPTAYESARAVPAFQATIEESDDGHEGE